MLLIASNTFWPSSRTPRTTSSETEVALRSSRTRTTAIQDQPHDRLFGKRAGVPGVPVALHFAPHPAHRVLADRAAKQGGECAAHPACVCARKVGACDQRVGNKCAPLIGP